MRKQIISWLCLVVPLVIIIWLVWHTWQKNPEAIQTVIDGPTSYGLLAAGLVLVLTAAATSFVRWHLLMRTLHIPIRLRDTMRLGFLGQVLNFVGPGQVGGDLFKALFIAHEQPGRKAEAIGTIIIDRACGLYALLIVASAALLISDVGQLQSGPIRTIAQLTYALTAVGTVSVVLVLIPPLAKGKMARRLTRVPRIGSAIDRLLQAVYLYQDNKLKLAAIGTLSLAVHILIAMAVYLAARGVYRDVPSMAEHFVISPIANVAGAIPLTPGGLGSFELAMTYLYDQLSPADAQGRGIVVAICYRLATIVVTSIGIVFYWMHHREVVKVMHEVEAIRSG